MDNKTINSSAAFDRCADFLARMFQKYAPLFEEVTIEDIRKIFNETQCKHE